MAAARAGVLGVRWLQRAARNVVPLGARTGPREQCGKGMPEVWCVGGRVDVMDTTAAVSGQGAEVKLVCPEEGVEGLVVLRGLGLRPPQPLQPDAVRVAGGTGALTTCSGMSSSLPHYQGYAPGTLSQDPRGTGCRCQEV